MNSHPNLLGKGAVRLGFALVFPHDVTRQDSRLLPTTGGVITTTGVGTSNFIGVDTTCEYVPEVFASKGVYSLGVATTTTTTEGA